ncbi:MAG: metallophosphoesterase [Woeseiaceae bacterium]
MHIRVLFLAALALAACTGTATSPGSSRVSILLFGDTGYDYDWLGGDDYEDAFTGREFILDELDDWIEENRPIEEFRLPPIHRAEQTGGYVMATGLWAVAAAVQSWCAPAARCDFGLMLGDNIYPSGATLGADGRDDRERFDALLWRPYKGLKEQDPEFVIYPVLGNHDWETSREGAMLQVEYLKNSPLYHMDGLYYRARPAPDVELFAIDTTIILAGETVYEDAVDAGGRPIDTGVVETEEPWVAPQGDETRMIAWLEDALAGSDARWKLVIGHHPLWSSSGTKQEQAKVLYRLLLPALCRHADAYLAGHDHTLEVHTDDCRSVGEHYRERPPLLQIVSGAAGKQRPLHTPFMRWQDREFPQKTTWFVEGLIWGFAEMVLEGERATVHVVSTPETGSGETQVEFSHTFARRSGRLQALDE